MAFPWVKKISKLTVQDLEEVDGANKDHLNKNTQGLLKAIKTSYKAKTLNIILINYPGFLYYISNKDVGWTQSQAVLFEGQT
jgi:hypothetical protein